MNVSAIDWHLVGELGVLNDTQVGHLYGVHRRTVRRHRVRLKIRQAPEAARCARQNIDWSKIDWSKTLSQIARDTGAHVSSVHEASLKDPENRRDVQKQAHFEPIKKGFRYHRVYGWIPKTPKRASPSKSTEEIYANEASRS